jgi:hypothetical protein
LKEILSAIADAISAPCDYATSFVDSMAAMANTATGAAALAEITSKCTGTAATAKAAASAGGATKIGAVLGISAVGAMLAMTDYGNST